MIPNSHSTGKKGASSREQGLISAVWLVKSKGPGPLAGRLFGGDQPVGDLESHSSDHVARWSTLIRQLRSGTNR